MVMAQTAAFPVPAAEGRGVGRRTMLAGAGAAGVASVASAGVAAGAAIGALPLARVLRVQSPSPRWPVRS